ncbi:V-type ATP synthase subunit D [Myxococcota bacterium]|nr:V-type ATP synthase subunit D [Myxococcota bacterium]MBU1380189.1 V-type ATP synthase subunit D [Myxococcota bacterium]MBU1497339.1 V-type ATP synthase subunit D [Myxococcota bacterium]
MSEKVKLNKNSLREQNQNLKLYLEFLPTLELRKQQLQTEVRSSLDEINVAKKDLQTILDGAKSFSAKISGLLQQIKSSLIVEEISVDLVNVAGVKVPQFQAVRFRKLPYSLVATPWIFDSAMAFFESAVSKKEQIRVLEEKFSLLDHELTKTTQRINLYEKVLIPQTRNNIRKIKVYLGDQQTAAVCRAKIAKNKIVKRTAQ